MQDGIHHVVHSRGKLLVEQGKEEELNWHTEQTAHIPKQRHRNHPQRPHRVHGGYQVQVAGRRKALI